MAVDELRESVRRDLDALSHMARRADDDTMREASVQVRRLVIDKTVDRLRKQSRIKGEVRVRAFDISSWNEPSVRSKVVTAMAGGAMIDDVGLIAGLLLNEGDRAVGEGVARDFPLSQYLSSTCMMIRMERPTGRRAVAQVFDLETVSRRDLIKYVANKLGGVHHDQSRNPQTERAYVLLDNAIASTSVPIPPLGDAAAGTMFGMRHAYWELLAVVQALVASRSVMSLVDLEPVPHPLDLVPSGPDAGRP